MRQIVEGDYGFDFSIQNPKALTGIDIKDYSCDFIIQNNENQIVLKKENIKRRGQSFYYLFEKADVLKPGQYLYGFLITKKDGTDKREQSDCLIVVSRKSISQFLKEG